MKKKIVISTILLIILSIFSTFLILNKIRADNYNDVIQTGKVEINYNKNSNIVEIKNNKNYQLSYNIYELSDGEEEYYSSQISDLLDYRSRKEDLNIQQQITKHNIIWYCGYSIDEEKNMSEDEIDSNVVKCINYSIDETIIDNELDEYNNRLEALINIINNLSDECVVLPDYLIEDSLSKTCMTKQDIDSLILNNIKKIEKLRNQKQLINYNELKLNSSIYENLQNEINENDRNLENANIKIKDMANLYSLDDFESVNNNQIYCPPSDKYRVLWIKSNVNGVDYFDFDIIEPSKNIQITNKVNITFDSLDGYVYYDKNYPKSMSISFTSGEMFKNLPIASKEGYTFDGWTTSLDNAYNTNLDSNLYITESMNAPEIATTYYAHYTKKDDEISEPIIKNYTITFNAMGGNVSQNTKIVENGAIYGTLPVPVRNGYTFDGWYTSYKDGNKIESNSIVSLNYNQTLYAHWILVQSNNNSNNSNNSNASSNNIQNSGNSNTSSNNKPQNNIQNNNTNKVSTNSNINVNNITSNSSNLKLYIGDTKKLNYTISPSNATNKNVLFKSSNDNIVKVDKNGNIKALKNGEATISIITVDGNKKVNCKVKVSKHQYKGTKIWPVKDLVIYKKSSGDSKTGKKVKSQTKLTILDSKDKRFKIKYNGTTGWISREWVMIDMITFDKRLEYKMPNASKPIYYLKNKKGKNLKVTTTKLYKTKVAALMYDTAVMLSKAQDKAEKKGYTIVVYDAYRPYSVTKYLYNTAHRIVGNGNKYNSPLGNLLARNRSSHNYGVAIDVTLKTTKDRKNKKGKVIYKKGEELDMPTNMHYIGTTAGSMNSNSKTLQKIMKSAGFDILTGTINGKKTILEWWHFQNNNSVNYKKEKNICNFNSNVK